VSNNRVLVPVLAGLGAAAVGVVVYAFAPRRPGSDRPSSGGVQPTAESEGARAPLRESMVVPRSTVPDPLEVDLDLDGIFRSVDAFQGQPDGLTVLEDLAGTRAEDAGPEEEVEIEEVHPQVAGGQRRG